MPLVRWLVFAAIGFAVSVPIGPNAVNAMRSPAAKGLRRSSWAVAGTLIAALAGMATLLMADAALFQAPKLAGAANLVWMGIALWRRRTALPGIATRAPAAGWCLLRRAFLISMRNAKSILA